MGYVSQTDPRPVLTQVDVKKIRQAIQDTVDLLNGYQGWSGELSLAITRLQEGKMWLGQELGNLGGEDLNAKRDKEELSTNIK